MLTLPRISGVIQGAWPAATLASAALPLAFGAPVHVPARPRARLMDQEPHAAQMISGGAPPAAMMRCPLLAIPRTSIESFPRSQACSLRARGSQRLDDMRQQRVHLHLIAVNAQSWRCLAGFLRAAGPPGAEARMPLSLAADLVACILGKSSNVAATVLRMSGARWSAASSMVAWAGEGLGWRAAAALAASSARALPVASTFSLPSGKEPMF